MKKTIYKITGILLAFSIITSYSIAQQPSSERFLQVISRLVEAMNESDYNRIVQEYSPGMQSTFSLTKTTLFFKNIESQYGKVVRLDPPQLKASDQASSLLYFEKGAQDLKIYLDDQSKIKGFLFTVRVITEPQPVTETKPETKPEVKPETKPEVKPETKPEPVKIPASGTVSGSTTTPAEKQPQPVVPVVADKQQTELYPPFKGNWITAAGGEALEGTGRPPLLQQKYSFAFTSTNNVGARYKNDGKTNEDYFVYGKEITAPAAGTIVEVIDGVRENTPGMQNLYAPVGNTIIIQHSEREYSVLSYLKPGSIRVKVGDKVTRGQTIAQCGNSGNTNEPMLHYHLQDSPYLQNAKIVKFYFERVSVVKDGKKEIMQIYNPKNSDVISVE